MVVAAVVIPAAAPGGPLVVVMVVYGDWIKKLKTTDFNISYHLSK